MKYLGIDYGTKLVGTAISNQEGTIAFPRVSYVSDDSLLEKLIKLIRDEKIERVVVGDTRSVGDRANPVTAEADNFIAALQASTAVEVIPVTEVWSSVEASRYAPKGEMRDDSAAAAIILQRYLEMQPGSAPQAESFEN